MRSGRVAFRSGWFNALCALAAVLGGIQSLPGITRTQHAFTNVAVQSVAPRGAREMMATPEVAAKLGVRTSTSGSSAVVLPLLALLGTARALRPTLLAARGKRAALTRVGVQLAAQATEGVVSCCSGTLCADTVQAAAVAQPAKIDGIKAREIRTQVPCRVAPTTSPGHATSYSSLCTGTSYTASVGHTGARRAARRVGSSRVSSVRNAKGSRCRARRSACAELRREHRRAGMRLHHNAVPVTLPVVLHLYDPSRLRSKIQCGLRRAASCRQPALAQPKKCDRTADNSVLARESLHQFSSQGHSRIEPFAQSQDYSGTGVEIEQQARHMHTQAFVTQS
mmetsp:Transcript_28759/g.52404  ORF Transcript_28759/g.52404 Transcript_28759/m.52404 type:complete len:338 (-) Transcript_28759:28-1041(-)